MNYLVSPTRIFSRVQSIEGISLLEEIQNFQIIDTIIQVVEEWTDFWDEDQGFGSSDETYLIKQIIDSLIASSEYAGVYMTAFTPCLSVVEYSEADHEEDQLKREIG